MIAFFSLLGALSATSVAQVSYKRFCLGQGRRHLYTAALLFGTTPVLTYYAVKAFGIGLVYVSTSVTYIAVALLGHALFGERITRRQRVAMALILAGSLIYGLGTR